MKRFRSALTGASLIALTACGTSTTAVTPAQVAADLTGLVNTLNIVVPQVEKAAPNALTPAQQTALANDLMNAKAALAGFAAGIPVAQGASQAQVVDGYINDVISTAAGIAPPPYNVAFVAASVILPEVEAFVNQYLPKSFTQTIAAMFTSPPAPKVGAAMAMSPDQARMKLGIPIVHQ
jgi:hypothetical protein